MNFVLITTNPKMPTSFLTYCPTYYYDLCDVPLVVRVPQFEKLGSKQHKLDKIHNDSAIKTNQPNQELEEKQLIGGANQTSPPKGIQPQISVTATEQF